MVFHEKAADRAARLLKVLPALAAFTACAHVQWDETATEAATLFSLATPAVANALQLRAFAEPGGSVCAALVVRGHHAPFSAVFRSDSRWHHVCVTWEQRSGRWALFSDGRRCAGAQGLSTGHPVPSNGVLVLGQDQDSLGGGFSAHDAFSGNLTDFHLWNRVLSLKQVHRARACAPPPGGLLFQWDPEALDVTPSLLPTVLVQLLCPGRTSQMICPSPGWPIESGPAPASTCLQLSLCPFDLSQFWPLPLQANSSCPEAYLVWACSVLASGPHLPDLDMSLGVVILHAGSQSCAGTFWACMGK